MRDTTRLASRPKILARTTEQLEVKTMHRLNRLDVFSGSRNRRGNDVWPAGRRPPAWLRAWLSSRLPPLLMVLGLLTVAVRPELVLGGTIGQADWGIPRTLLVLALIGNALCYGLRRGINWPIAALILALAQCLCSATCTPS